MAPEKSEQPAKESPTTFAVTGPAVGLPTVEDLAKLSSVIMGRYPTKAELAKMQDILDGKETR